jgi:hypothetical protein
MKILTQKILGLSLVATALAAIILSAIYAVDNITNYKIFITYFIYMLVMMGVVITGLCIFYDKQTQ